MKFWIGFFVLAFVANKTAWSQRLATDEAGQTVYLYSDGTWSYERHEEGSEGASILRNPKAFRRSSQARKLLQSEVNKLGLYYNPSLWDLSEVQINSVAEFSLMFRAKDKPIYVMMINEPIELPIATLRQAALVNAKASATRFKMIREEYREVNGLEVLMLEFEATLQGLDFRYLGYYVAHETGTSQLLCFSSTKLMDEKQLKNCEDLLNGLVLAR